MSETKQILVEMKSSTRVLTLNRPKQMNTITKKMVSELLDLIPAYEKDPTVKLLILKGNGRAFCAGGDIVTMSPDLLSGNWREIAAFFRKSFTLDYLIAMMSKTQVSILNGVVMGAGAGISIHGRFRVATEKSVFAMPEVFFGLFPDVGASYFLSRLPGFFGEYVALTGSRLDGAEMLSCGLATHFVPSERLSSLEESLINADTSDPTVISTVISKFSLVPNLKETSIFYQSRIINHCFSRKTVEEIEMEAADNKENWLLVILKALRKASPTSLKITLRSVREGRLQEVDKCLTRDYRMVVHVLNGEISNDLTKGIRAMFVDKDKNPKWNPSRLELVTDDVVEKYLSSVDDDLVLPKKALMAKL